MGKPGDFAEATLATHGMWPDISVSEPRNNEHLALDLSGFTRY